MAYKVDVQYKMGAPERSYAERIVAHAQQYAGAAELDANIEPTELGYDVTITYTAQVPTEEAAENIKRNAHSQFGIGGSTHVETTIEPMGAMVSESIVPEDADAMMREMIANRQLYDERHVIDPANRPTGSDFDVNDLYYEVPTFAGISSDAPQYLTMLIGGKKIHIKMNSDSAAYIGYVLEQQAPKLLRLEKGTPQREDDPMQAYEDVRPPEQSRSRGGNGGGLPRSARPRIRN